MLLHQSFLDKDGGLLTIQPITLVNKDIILHYKNSNNKIQRF